MTLFTAWERIEMRPKRSIRAGRRLQAYDEMPAGPAHVVEDESTVALCGVDVRHRGHEWPSGLGTRCRECARLAATA